MPPSTGRARSIERNNERKARNSAERSSSSSNQTSSNPDEFKFSFGGKSYENKADATAASRAGRNPGIVTSDSASTTVNNSRNTLNNIGSGTGATVPTTGGNNVQNQLSELFKQLSTARGQLETAQASEKLAKDNLDNNKQTDLADGINAINTKATGGKADTSAVDDPVLRAITDASINRISNTQAQITRLDDYRKLMSAYSQGEIDDISSTALRSVERQVKENDRVQRAMEFAGIIGGRAQMAPVVEGTLIHEIIQDGLDRIDVIEDKKTTAIRAARKAESEFNYKLFTESVTLANQFNTEIEDSITKLKTEVRQAEKDEQEKTTFRQAQQERNSLILAGELTEATPELIRQAADANGIDLGLLMKAVNDAKFEKANRKFTGEDNALSLIDKRSSIDKRNNDMRLDNAANARAAAAAARDAEAIKEIKLPEDIAQSFRSEGLSKSESQTVFSEIEEFGLDNLVEIYLEEGNRDKDEIKAIVRAHERIQRPKNNKDDKEVLTPTEIRLNAFIDRAKTSQQKKFDRLAKDKFVVPTAKFFKE